MSLKCSYEFRIMKRTLKTVLRIFLITYRTVSITPFINREIKSRSTQFIYTVIVVIITIKFPSYD